MEVAALLALAIKHSDTNKAPSTHQKSKAARDRYREAMGDEWLTRSQIEQRIGMKPKSTAKVFRKMLADGFVERKPAPNRGWFFRWNHGTK